MSPLPTGLRRNACTPWKSCSRGASRGHDIAPLVTDLMKIGVADAAEENLELHVAFGRIAPWNHGGGQWRCRTGSRVGLRVVHGFVLLLAFCSTPVELPSCAGTGR